MTPRCSGPILPSRPSTLGRNEVHVHELGMGEGCLGRGASSRTRAMVRQRESGPGPVVPQRVMFPPAPHLQ